MTIPIPVITAVAGALKDTYSESELRGLFLAANIKNSAEAITPKARLCMECLGWANENLSNPIETLGGIIGELLDRDASAPDSEGLRDRQEQILEALARQNLSYQAGGHIEHATRAYEMTTSAKDAATPESPTAPRATSQPQATNIATQAARTEVKMSTVLRSRPTLFIGSTVEALEVARAVHAELDHDLDVTIWNHGLFSPGISTWAQLIQSTHNYDFALFVFSGDDEVQSRGEQSIAVRDNLLIEYGLFVGVLGADRTFFLYNRDHRPKIASDLGGITPLTYRDRDELQPAVSPACTSIRRVAVKLGKVDRGNP